MAKVLISCMDRRLNPKLDRMAKDMAKDGSEVIVLRDAGANVGGLEESMRDRKAGRHRPDSNSYPRRLRCDEVRVWMP